jgi:autotransporter-associated beta strand protein
LLAASPVAAQLVYEPFDYGSAATGTKLANLTDSPTFSGYQNPSNGINWFEMQNATGSPTEITLNTPSLSVPVGLAPATGGDARYGTANVTSARSARIQITPGGFTSGTVYYSFSFKVTDVTGLASTGAGSFFAILNDSAGTTNLSPSGPARLHLRSTGDVSDPTAFTIGIKAQSNATTAPQAQFDTTDIFHQGDSIFVVGAYTMVGSMGTDDTSSLWVNPDASSFGAPVAPATSCPDATGGGDVSGIASFALREGNALLAAGIEVDELRLGTTWASVTAPVGAVWNGASGDNWTDGTKWSTGISPSGAAQFVTFGAGGGGTVQVPSGQTVGTMNIKNVNSYDIGGAGAAALTMDGGVGGEAAINVMATMDATGPGVIIPSSHSISAPLVLDTNLAVNVSQTQSLEVSGDISGNATLAKNGAGTLLLSGNNTFTGNVTAGNGTLAISSDAALGNAANTLVIDGGAVRTAGAINSSRTINVNSNTIGNRTYGGGTFDTNGLNSAVGTIIGAGTLTKVGTGVLTAPSVRIGSLTINDGAVHVAANGTDSGVSTVKALAFAGVTDAWIGRLDVDNNALAIDYPTAGPSVLDTVQNQIKSGFNSGAWGGNGIDSSAAAATATNTVKTALGYGEASVIVGPSGGTWKGQSVDGTAILVAYTLFGDANVDFTVDTTDFNLLASNFSQSGKHWTDGDFNYDGTIDTTDFNLLASNFGQVVPAAPLGTLVPEPTSITLAAIGAVALMGGRRRRKIF